MRHHLKTDFRTRPPHPFHHKNGYYYLIQRIAGKQVWRSLGTKNRGEADKLAFGIWHAQQSPGLREFLALPSCPLEMAWEDYVKSENWGNVAKSTRDVRACRWKTFLSWCANRSVADVNSITQEVAEEYLSTCGTKNHTWNNTRSDLSAVFDRFCGKMHLDNPFKLVSPRTVTKGERASLPFRPFSDTEVKTVIKGFDKSLMNHSGEWRTACKIGALTGLRFKDVALLKWDHIKDGVMELVPHKTASASKKSILARLSPELLSMLGKLPRKGIYVVPGLASCYSEKTSTKYFSKYLKRNKISSDERGKVGFHSFRVRLATLAGKRGVNMDVLGGVLGHSDKRQTEHYNKAAIALDLSFASLKALENV